MDIVVLGLGRFGRLWSSCMARLGQVRAYDPNGGFNGDTLPSGVQRLANREALHQALQGCDVLFFCVPISSLQDALTELNSALCARLRLYLRHEAPTLWLMDTCSVKVRPMAWLRDTCRKIHANSATKSNSAFRLLGLHPMFGPDSIGAGPNSPVNDGHARANLRLVLCPDEIEAAEVELWEQRFARMGLTVIILSAEQHDREAAHTQGLTHLLGRVLQILDVRESAMATTGYQVLCQLREQTCHDTWQLFIDLQRQNSYTPAMRRELQKALEIIYMALEGTNHGRDTRQKN